MPETASFAWRSCRPQEGQGQIQSPSLACGHAVTGQGRELTVFYQMATSL